MKRLLALLLGGLGLRALLRRRAAAVSGAPQADDLRAKLAEARATAEAQVEDAEEPVLPVDEVPDVVAEPEADVDTRVHARRSTS